MVTGPKNTDPLTGLPEFVPDSFLGSTTLNGWAVNVLLNIYEHYTLSFLPLFI